MKIVIEAENSKDRENGSQLNFGATMPGNQNGFNGQFQKDFKTVNRNSFDKLNEIFVPGSPAPMRNKKGLFAGDSIFSSTNNQINHKLGGFAR